MKTIRIRAGAIPLASFVLLAILFLLCSCANGETGDTRSEPTATAEPVTVGPLYVEVYGKEFPQDAEEIVFSGDEINGFDELFGKLGEFTSLGSIDFGSLTVEAEEAAELKKELGDIDVKICVYVGLGGLAYDPETRDLDLTCADPGIIPEATEKLGFFPDLQSVDLRGTEITPEQQTELVVRYPGVRFLWEVDILGAGYDSGTEDLDLSGSDGLTLDDVRRVIPLFCDLKRLDLSDCGFENEELGALREEFPATKIVWRLYMGKWSLKTDAVAFSVLIYNYNYTALKSSDIEVLKYCTDLQALDLGHQRLTDLSVIGDCLTELRILILADNTVSDLTPLANLKHLHYLELFVNPKLTDLSPLGACKEMVDLNISHLYTVTDISALLDFPILERLWIENTGVSGADIQRLKDAYPDATVTVNGWGSVDQGWRTHPRYYAMIDMFHKTDYISEEFSKYDSED